jgi:hypothetical protein
MGRDRVRRRHHLAFFVAPALILLLLVSVWGVALPAGSRHAEPVPAVPQASPITPLRSEGADRAPLAGSASLREAVAPQSSSVSWLNITSGLVRGPSARSNASVAYDSQDNLLLLYGGENGSGVLSDTWEFTGGAWVLLSSTSSPGPRYGAGLAYDPTQHYFVLFGGNTSTGPGIHTWLFENGHWAIDSVGGQPMSRVFPAFAYDPVASAVLMFGGAQSGNQSGVVWWFAQKNWTLKTVGGPGTPSHRAAAAFFSYQNMTTPADSGMVLFGGYSTDPGTNRVFRDTWLYGNANGTFGWSELSANSLPPARFDPAVSFDPSSAATLMFGGFAPTGGALDDAWSYNASGWSATSFSSAGHPSARGGAAMALAPIPGKPNVAYTAPASPLLAGGQAQRGVYYSDSWFVGPLPLSLLAPLVPPTSDVDTLAQLSVTIFNQGAPAIVTWIGLPLGCAGNNRTSFTCEPTQIGGETISVTISLGSLSVTSGVSNWTVNALPRIALFTVLPSPSVVGKSTTIQVGVAVGSGTTPFTYQFLGLPGGCSSADLPQFSCSPTSAGSYEIEVIVQDADGQSASAEANLTVAASGGSGSTPLWEYAVEGLGALLVILVVAFILRNKMQRGRPTASTVRRWDGPNSPPSPSGSAPSPPADSEGANTRT